MRCILFLFYLSFSSVTMSQVIKLEAVLGYM